MSSASQQGERLETGRSGPASADTPAVGREARTGERGHTPEPIPAASATGIRPAAAVLRGHASPRREASLKTTAGVKAPAAFPARRRWGSVVTRLYRAWCANPDWTNRQLAEAVGASQPYVRAARKRMARPGWVPPLVGRAEE